MDFGDKVAEGVTDSIPAGELECINASLFEDSNKAMADEEHKVQSLIVEQQNKAIEQIWKMSNSLQSDSEINEESLGIILEQSSEMMSKCDTLMVQLMIKISLSLKKTKRMRKRKKK